jgi:hypothetical protein
MSSWSIKAMEVKVRSDHAGASLCMSTSRDGVEGLYTSRMSFHPLITHPNTIGAFMLVSVQTSDEDRALSLFRLTR